MNGPRHAALHASGIKNNSGYAVAVNVKYQIWHIFCKDTTRETRFSGITPPLAVVTNLDNGIMWDLLATTPDLLLQQIGQIRLTEQRNAYACGRGRGIRKRGAIAKGQTNRRETPQRQGPRAMKLRACLPEGVFCIRLN